MAGNRSLGVLTLDLVVKAGAFTAGMTGAERQAAKSLSAIEKRAYKFGQVLGTSIKAGAVLATAALAAVSVAVGNAINNADSIRDLSVRTGVATEKLSEYAYAAKQTGTDIDGLGRGFKLLAKNIAEAADPSSGKGKLFAALGIDVKDAAGNLKQLDAILPEIANKFKLMEDGTTKAAVAQELFGKSGADLIEFLNLGADGLETAAEKARSLGIVISSETAAAADEFNDKLGDLRARSEGFALTLAAGLLPQLNKTVEEFGRIVSQGDLANNIIVLISSAAQFGVGIINQYNNAVSRTSIIFGLVAESGSGYLEVLKNIYTFGAADGGVVDGLKKMKGGYDDAQTSLDRLVERQKELGEGSLFGGVTAKVTSTYDDKEIVRKMREQRAESARLAKLAFGEDSTKPSKPSRSGASGGKSDAEREADQLKAAYDRMNASLVEQIALHGETSEVAKLRYQFENEDLSKLDAATRRLIEAKREEALVNTEKLEQMKLMDELQSAADKAVQADSKAFADQAARTKDYIADLEYENSLYGLSNVEIDKRNALRYAGVDAMSEEGQKISELIEQNHALAESYGFVDDVKAGLADMFVDFVSGAKSAKEAFGDFADQLFKRALQFVADKAIQAMFDAFKSDGSATQGGGAGGGWGGFFSSILGAFGGGRANGGGVQPWSMYEVNESGMEGLTVNNRDYLMTGSKAGVVTPNHRLGGGGSVINNQFIVGPQNNQSTQEQIANRTAFELQQAQRRNS